MNARNAQDLIAAAIFAVYTTEMFDADNTCVQYQIICDGYRYPVVNKETGSPVMYVLPQKAIEIAPRIIEDRIFDDLKAAGLNIRKVISSTEPLGGMWRHRTPQSPVLVYVEPAITHAISV